MENRKAHSLQEFAWKYSLLKRYLCNFSHLLHRLVIEPSAWSMKISLPNYIHLGNYTRRNAPAVERTVPHLSNVNCNETSKSNYKKLALFHKIRELARRLLILEIHLYWKYMYRSLLGGRPIKFQGGRIRVSCISMKNIP